MALTLIAIWLTLLIEDQVWHTKSRYCQSNSFAPFPSQVVSNVQALRSRQTLTFVQQLYNDRAITDEVKWRLRFWHQLGDECLVSIQGQQKKPNTLSILAKENKTRTEYSQGCQDSDEERGP